jgi:hypothetical protein
LRRTPHPPHRWGLSLCSPGADFLPEYLPNVVILLITLVIPGRPSVWLQLGHGRGERSQTLVKLHIMARSTSSGVGLAGYVFKSCMRNGASLSILPEFCKYISSFGFSVPPCSSLCHQSRFIPRQLFSLCLPHKTPLGADHCKFNDCC